MYTFVGIVATERDSIFSYKVGENWTTFHRPNYTPLYGPIFQDAALEKEARETCKNDTFCLYDIAATGRLEIGMATLRGSEQFDQLVELSAPGERIHVDRHVVIQMSFLIIYSGV